MTQEHSWTHCAKCDREVHVGVIIGRGVKNRKLYCRKCAKAVRKASESKSGRYSKEGV